MGCTNADALTGITYACSDVATGGLKTVYIAHKADVTPTEVSGEVDSVVFVAADDRVLLDFNNKDAFTSFTDVKTVDATGVVNSIPTIVMEFPKMTTAKRTELEVLTNSGLELVAFVRTAADTYHMAGYEYGMYASEVNGQSGAGRTDKNVYQLTLVGEEDSLAVPMNASGWADVVAGATT